MNKKYIFLDDHFIVIDEYGDICKKVPYRDDIDNLLAVENKIELIKNRIDEIIYTGNLNKPVISNRLFTKRKKQCAGEKEELQFLKKELLKNNKKLEKLNRIIPNKDIDCRNYYKDHSFINFEVYNFNKDHTLYRKRKLYYELGYNKDKYLKMKNISLVKKLKKDGFNDSEIETFQNELQKVKKISR